MLIKSLRWRRDESMNATIVVVPSKIMTYSCFLNVIDRFDHFRFSHTTVRKEKKVPKSIFRFLLEASVLNRCALHRFVASNFLETKLSLCEFNRRVAESFVTPLLARRPEQITVRKLSVNKDSPSSIHMLLSTYASVCVRCFHCRRRGFLDRSIWTRFACFQCSLAFDAECFSLWNYRKKFEEASQEVASKLYTSDSAAVTTRKWFRNLCAVLGVSDEYLSKEMARKISQSDRRANSSPPQFVQIQRGNSLCGSFILSQCSIAEPDEGKVILQQST